MNFALITGGSGGIGLSIAKELAQKKYNLLLVARSEEKLRLNSEQLASEYNVEAHYLAIDLTTEGADKKLVDWVIDNGWSINILVNNAGYALWGSLHKITPEETQNMMWLNMNVLVSLCARCIPLLAKNQKSYILNIASTTAYQAIPSLSVYAATKSFVVSFTRGLRWELKEQSISVSCLSPGATSTSFMDRANMDALKETAEKVSMSPDEVAKIAVKGLFKGKAEIIPGLINQVSVGLVGLLPKALSEKIAYQIYHKTSPLKK